MSAVLEHPIEIGEAEAAERAERRFDGRERSALEFSLQAWGEWHERNSDFEGFPRADAIASFIDGAGGSSNGHRILCLEMPKTVRDMNWRVQRLPEHEQIAVWAHYVPCVKENGQVWTPEEKAERLQIRWGTYRTRLTRARFRIMGLVPPV